MFDDYDYYFEEDDGKTAKREKVAEYKLYPRQKIYQYNNVQDLNKIVQYAERRFSKLKQNMEQKHEQLVYEK